MNDSGYIEKSAIPILSKCARKRLWQIFILVTIIFSSLDTEIFQLNFGRCGEFENKDFEMTVFDFDT